MRGSGEIKRQSIGFNKEYDLTQHKWNYDTNSLEPDRTLNEPDYHGQSGNRPGMRESRPIHGRGSRIPEVVLNKPIRNLDFLRV